LRDDFEKEVKKTVEVLSNGGVILYPTDTVWGLGCDATNDQAIERIYKIKKRQAEKSMIVLLDDEKKLVKYIKEIPDQAWNLIEFSTKPLTIIYDQAVNVSRKIIADDGSLGIRITRDAFCKEIVRRLRNPVVSTSANISNEPAPNSYNEISDEVLNAVDYVVNLRRQNADQKPSTIIKLGTRGNIQIIRR
jgi:L-threonylcarbamoyladenylate synthase